MKIHEERKILSDEEKSSLEKLHTQLKNLCVQNNERKAAMPFQDFAKLCAQRDGRATLKWDSNEMRAGRPQLSVGRLIGMP